jgi:hypothetical protein
MTTEGVGRLAAAASQIHVGFDDSPRPKEVQRNRKAELRILRRPVE